MAQSYKQRSLTTCSSTRSYMGFACIDANVNDSVKRLGWPFAHGGIGIMGTDDA